MPGQGKQLCINYIAESLGYEVVNIIISQWTKVEDLLGKNIITKDKYKNIKVLLNETRLSKALKKQTDNNQKGKELIFVSNNLNNVNHLFLNYWFQSLIKIRKMFYYSDSDSSNIPKNPIALNVVLEPPLFWST